MVMRMPVRGMTRYICPSVNGRDCRLWFQAPCPARQPPYTSTTSANVMMASWTTMPMMRWNEREPSRTMKSTAM